MRRGAIIGGIGGWDEKGAQKFRKPQKFRKSQIFYMSVFQNQLYFN